MSGLIKKAFDYGRAVERAKHETQKIKREAEQINNETDLIRRETKAINAFLKSKK